MNKSMDPKEFGITGKAGIEQISGNHFALVISRKSRIIMSDGKKILEKAEKIKQARPGSKVSVRTSTPMCSKTKMFLHEHSIEII